MEEKARQERIDSQRRLQGIRELGQDWDSYGAAPIRKEACDVAERLLALFDWSLTPIPTVIGGVQLEAHGGELDFELEILPDGEVIGLYIADDLLNKETELEPPSDLDFIQSEEN